MTACSRPYRQRHDYASLPCTLAEPRNTASHPLYAVACLLMPAHTCHLAQSFTHQQLASTTVSVSRLFAQPQVDPSPHSCPCASHNMTHRAHQTPLPAGIAPPPPFPSPTHRSYHIARQHRVRSTSTQERIPAPAAGPEAALASAASVCCLHPHLQGPCQVHAPCPSPCPACRPAPECCPQQQATLQQQQKKAHPCQLRPVW